MKIKTSIFWVVLGLFTYAGITNNLQKEKSRALEGPPAKDGISQSTPANSEAERIQTLEQTVRKIPATKLEANLEGYQQLVRLAPHNQFYKNKVSFYEQKIEARTKNRITGETTLNLSEKRERINVPSDPSASYYLLNIANLANGNLEITTRRDGRSGKSYAIRLVQCEPLRFNYIAEGFDFGGREEVVENLVRIQNPKLTNLVRGSISDVISRYACAHRNKPVTKKSLDPQGVLKKTETLQVQKTKERKQSKYNAKEIVWIEKTKSGVKTRLKDPKSSEFKNVSFHYYQDKTPMVCGEVNSRNSLGSFTGFEGFVGSGNDFIFLESEFKGDEFSKTWDTLCKN